MNRAFQIRIGGALLLLVLWSRMPAQEAEHPPLRVPEAVNEPAEFAPAGWRMEKEILKEGDLNGDGRPDAALVITSGEAGVNAKGESTFVKHVLVLALRGSDGKLHRSVVSDAAVLDGNEGGVFGDPFDSLLIERGAVVISHYGGSRDRWSYTHRYRFQNGQWMLIGLTLGNTDTLDLEHFDDQDINLSTGLVNSHEKGESDPPQGRKSRKPEISGSYYELETLPVERRPTIDGQFTAEEWPGYTVRLNNKQSVYRNLPLWRGIDDLSAQLHAVRMGDDLFVAAEVVDNEVGAGDEVRLVTKKGLAIRPVESKLSRSGKGHIFEARYSLKAIVKTVRPGDEYAEQELQSAIDPDAEFGDVTGLAIPVSVEVVDVDDSQSPKVRSTLSTRPLGSPYSGSIRVFRKGTLVLTSDKE
jgi:hypothetical protein